MGWSYAQDGGHKETSVRILRRDRGRCHECGLPGADEVDHVTPRAEGGTDDDANLAAIHHDPCHLAKTEREKARGRARRSTRRPPKPHPGVLR